MLATLHKKKEKCNYNYEKQSININYFHNSQIQIWLDGVIGVNGPRAQPPVPMEREVDIVCAIHRHPNMECHFARYVAYGIHYCFAIKLCHKQTQST